MALIILYIGFTTPMHVVLSVVSGFVMITVVCYCTYMYLQLMKLQNTKTKKTAHGKVLNQNLNRISSKTKSGIFVAK